MALSVPRVSVDTVRGFLRTYDLVFLVAFLWFMVQFLRYVFPPLFGTFQATYGVSNTQTGLLFTLLMFGYSAMQFPGGWLSDRLHEVTVIVGGAVLFTIAAVFAGLAPTFALITLAAVGIGLGTGVHKTVAIAYLSRVYPERTGLSLGIMDTVGQFGGMVAPIAVAVVLASVFPWGTVFLGGAVVSAVLAGALYYRAHPRKGYERRDQQLSENVDKHVARAANADIESSEGNEPPQTERSQPSPGVDTDTTVSKADVDTAERTSYITIFSNRRLLTFLCVTMLFTFAWNGLSAFYPLFLADEKGLSSGMAAIAYSVLFAASVTQTVTGGASDTLGKLTISIPLFGLMIVSLLALLVTQSVWVILGLTVLLGIGFHGFRPVRDAYLMDLIPSSIGGGTLGIVRTGMTAIGAAAPAIIGFTSDILGYVAAFGVIAVALVCGVVLLLVLR